MSKTMLYKQGSMITCGQHSLDYIIVDDNEVSDHLKIGWVKSPDETVAKTKKNKAAQNGEDKG